MSNLTIDDGFSAISREFSVLNLGAEDRVGAISREFSVLNLGAEDRVGAISREFSVLNLGAEDRVSAISREYSVENQLEASDLQVVSVEPSLPTALAGTALPVVLTVTNASANPAFGPRQDALALRPVNGGRDVPLGTFVITNHLAGGASEIRTNLAVIPAAISGAFHLVLTLDVNQEVWEPGSESNNTGVSLTTVTVGAPDLMIGSLVLSSDRSEAGTSVTAQWVVFNEGSDPTRVGWQDGIYLATSVETLGQARLLTLVTNRTALMPGGRYTNSAAVTLPLSGDLPPGGYVLAVMANADRFLPEATLENNVASHQFTLTHPPLPDLAVAEVIAPTAIAPGQSFFVSWAVTNQGPADVVLPWLESIYVVDDGVTSLTPGALLDRLGTVPALGTFRAPELSLASGSGAIRGYEATLPSHFAAGHYRIVVRVDSANEVVEAQEANNTGLSAEASIVPLTLTWQLTGPSLTDGGTPLNALLWRNGGLTNALTVTLSNSLPAALSLPLTATFSSNEVSVPLVLSPRRDPAITGPRVAELIASVSNHLGGWTNVTVADADSPALVLELPESDRVVEGGSLPAIVRRTGPTNAAVTVSFSSPTPAQFFLPVPVIIPAGLAEISFSLVTADDSLIEATESYFVRVSAPGHLPAEIAVTIEDDDLPVLALEISPATFSEGAGPSAAFLTVRRQTDSTRPLVIALDNSNPSAVTAPGTITIPAFNSMASVPVGAVNNDQLDGSRTARITATARLSGSTQPIGEPVSALVTITDDDGPTLTLSLARTVVREGEATTATVRRNTGTTGDLVVNLSSSSPADATVPPTVTIPAGASEAQFPVTSLTDSQSDGSKPLTLSASASGYSAGAAVLTVTDADLPDLVVSEVSAPTSALVGERVNLTFRVANQGLVPARGRFLQRVFLSRDPLVGDDILIGNFDLTPAGEGLAPGLSIATVPRHTFTETGNYWVVVTADVEDGVEELDETNNTRIAAHPIEVRWDFTATVQVDLPNRGAPAGTPVPLSGHAETPGGQPAVAKRVDVHLQLREFRCVLSATTDAAGNFSLVFQPLPGESGHYSVGAARGGEVTATPQDEFALYGAAFEPARLEVRVGEGSSVGGRVWLRNLSEVPLSGLRAEILAGEGRVAGAVVLSVGQLAGLDSLEAHYTLTAAPQAGGNSGPPQRADLTLRVTTAEGTMHDLPITVTVEPLRPFLAADPSELVAAMLRGSQKVVEFQVINTGQTETGPLTVLLPDAPWLTLMTTNLLPSLPPGARNSVSLLLSPNRDLDLGAHEGQLAIHGEDVTLSVPFKFLSTSDTLGHFRITAEDEYTYFAEGEPNVTNAAVRITDAVTQQIVTNGVTDAQGYFFVTHLPEGHYEIEVTAEKHGDFRAIRLLGPGQDTNIVAFLPRQTVQYVWRVEEVPFEDRVRVNVETLFETHVPVPVITVDPAAIDLSPITGPGQQMQVNLKISNHGLIEAQHGKLQFSSDSRYVATPLLFDLGTLSVTSSIVVPVTIAWPSEGVRQGRNIARAESGSSGSCAFGLSVSSLYLCGGNFVTSQTSISGYGAAQCEEALIPRNIEASSLNFEQFRSNRSSSTQIVSYKPSTSTESASDCDCEAIEISGLIISGLPSRNLSSSDSYGSSSVELSISKAAGVRWELDEKSRNKGLDFKSASGNKITVNHDNQFISGPINIIARYKNKSGNDCTPTISLPVHQAYIQCVSERPENRVRQKIGVGEIVECWFYPPLRAQWRIVKAPDSSLHFEEPLRVDGGINRFVAGRKEGNAWIEAVPVNIKENAKLVIYFEVVKPNGVEMLRWGSHSNRGDESYDASSRQVIRIAGYPIFAIHPTDVSFEALCFQEKDAPWKREGILISMPEYHCHEHNKCGWRRALPSKMPGISWQAGNFDLFSIGLLYDRNEFGPPAPGKMTGTWGFSWRLHDDDETLREKFADLENTWEIMPNHSIVGRKRGNIGKAAKYEFPYLDGMSWFAPLEKTDSKCR